MIWWLLPALAGPAQDRVLIGQLDREVIALRQKVQLLEERVQTCATGDPLPIYGELSAVLAGQEAAVARSGRGVTVTIPLDTLFSPEGRELREEAAPLVDLVATALALHPDLRVTVVAHAAGTIPASLKKQYPTQWEFSAWRASLVVRALIERFSVPAARLTAAARADVEADTSQATPDGSYKDRRIVFLIEPGGSP